jgi:hypothetical protein
VPDADLVVDVAVRDGEVGHDEVGEVEPLEHLLDDERPDVLVRADRLVAQLPDHRLERLGPQRVEVDRGDAVVGWGHHGLAAERHDHEAERA